MKTSIILFSFLFFCALSINAQENSTPDYRQVGLTGLPIFYLNNGTGGGINGLALYGNFGWFIKTKDVVGLRPFFGVVRSGFNNAERLQSVGSNVYYRRYLNRNRFSFFIDVNAGFGYIWYSSSIPGRDEAVRELNGILFNYALGPGVNYDLKNGLTLELIIQYLQMTNINHTDETFIGNTLIPSIGIQKFF